MVATSRTQPHKLLAMSLTLGAALCPGQALDLLQASLVEGLGTFQHMAISHCVTGMAAASGAATHMRMILPAAAQVKYCVQLMMEVL